MSEPLRIVKIMRNKEVIGNYKYVDILKLLSEGTLLPTDLYWFKGMSGWIKLGQLKENEDTKLKAKADEDRQVAEAVKVRLELERKSQFRCNCCHLVFKKPSDISGVPGVVLWFCSMIACGISSLLPWSLAPLAIAGYCVSIILMGVGFCIFLASLLRSPYCPSCESSNFSRQE